MKGKAGRSEWGRRKWTGGSTFGLTVAAVRGVLVVFGSASEAPTSIAASTHKHVAPYTGNETDLVFAEATGGGTTMALPVSPFFDLTSGHGVQSAKATSRPCAGANSSLSIDSFAGLMTNPSTGTTGTYHFRVSWMMSFSVQLQVVPGAASELPSAFFYVFADSEVSAAIGTTYFPNNSPLVTQTIFSGSFSHT
jgi:hypothetical protein